jgi:hypothetical protein
MGIDDWQPGHGMLYRNFLHPNKFVELPFLFFFQAQFNDLLDISHQFINCTALRMAGL